MNMVQCELNELNVDSKKDSASTTETKDMDDTVVPMSKIGTVSENVEKIDPYKVDIYSFYATEEDDGGDVLGF